MYPNFLTQYAKIVHSTITILQNITYNSTYFVLQGAYVMARKRMNFIQSLTLKQLHEEYINYCKINDLSPTSIDGYYGQFKIISKYIDTANTYLDDITSSTIDDFIERLRDDTGATNVTINNRLNYIRILLQYAYKKGYVSTAINIPRLKEKPKPKIPLSDEELKLLLKIEPHPPFHIYRNHVICQVILATGIRSRNIREVKVSDLNLKDRTLYLYETKNRQSYYIYLSASITDVLSQYILKTKLPSDSPLFPNVYGEQFTRLGFSRSMTEYFAQQGVPRCTPHLLRHTYASRLANTNVPINVISQMLCHSSIVTTQRYIHTMKDDIIKHSDEVDILSDIENQIKPKRRTKIK